MLERKARARLRKNFVFHAFLLFVCLVLVIFLMAQLKSDKLQTILKTVFGL